MAGLEEGPVTWAKTGCEHRFVILGAVPVSGGGWRRGASGTGWRAEVEGSLEGVFHSQTTGFPALRTGAPQGWTGIVGS